MSHPCRGTAHTLAKLTDADVRAIRTALTKGTGSFKSLALQYGVDRNVIRGIYRGTAWRHLLRPTDAIGQCSPVPSASRLTLTLAREIRKRYATGRETYLSLSKRFGVTPQAIGAIVRAESWVDPA